MQLLQMESKSRFPHNLFRVQCLPPCKNRKVDVNKTYQTYCVKLDYVDTINQDLDSDSYHLQAILFDDKYKKFVGSCWKGNPVKMKNKRITFSQKFYFYTAIPGKELILVVELITGDKLLNCDKTVGWICTPLIDTEESGSTLEHSVSFKVPILHGSPLALFILTDGTRGSKLFEHTTGLELSLTLMPYPLLLQTAHLVPENILFDAADIIPGLISDSVDVVNSVGYTYKPHLQKSITFILESICIKIHPSVEEVEKIILEKIIKEHETSESSNETASKAHIIQRRLQVGVHNGYCFIQECDFYHLLIEPIVTPKAQKTHQRSSSMGSINYSRENGLTLHSDIKILNVPDDPNIAFVFLMEYTISLSNTSSGQSNVASSISKSPTSNIAIAWGFIKLSNLRTNPSQTVTLTCDPSSPYKVLFLKTLNKCELSFTAASLIKQNKNMSAGHSVGDFGSVASFSSKTYVSPETSYLHSPATSTSAPKHKSLGDIPETVMQNEVGCSKSRASSQTYRDYENTMNLQEVTLVSSSLPLVPPLLHSFPVESGSAFKEFTKIYWDKLRPVVDHRGRPASILDSSHSYNINKDLELHSPPQINECMLQLLAISCLEEYGQMPSEIFFTFQFYRFLPVRTESFILKPLTERDPFLQHSSMVYALLKFRDREKGPGFQVTYNIDPSELGVGEYRPFQHYLMKHTLHIDLWNGQSLLYFGTVLLPLKYFCRQGKDAVCANLELDIINCEFPDETLSQTSAFSKTCTGKLHLRLASIRHPLSSEALEKIEGDSLNSESYIIYPKTEKTNSEASIPTISKARPIVETNRELTNLLASRCVVNCSQTSQGSFLTEEKKRKLARMEAVRNLEDESKATQVLDDGMHHFLKERERDMLTIESYIQKNKSDMIQSLLHASVTYEKVIYPVIGNKAFFEFVLENPFPEAKEVEISWKCPELSLVTDRKLWQTLRNMHGIPKKAEQIAFSDENSDVPSLLLQPKEKIHIPFSYCSLAIQSSQLEVFKTASGHHFTSDILTSAPVSSSLITSTVKVRFMTQDQTLLAVLLLIIQPLPPSFTHVFKFLSMEHSMFKKVIRINFENSRSHKIVVRCSDPEAVCSIQEPHDCEDDISIQIKAPTKAAGKFKEFYIFMYKDSFQIIAFQTWIVTICPLQRIDLSCISGQLMRSSLLIRGTHATNSVRCFSSSPDLQLHPSDSFMLSPFGVQELSMNVRSLLPGIKHFQITMVNQALELVLQSWLLVLSCQKPSVSKAFQVHLNVGKEATKRITYRNPYSYTKFLILHCSHPHLLRLKESIFEVPTGKSYCIGLYFLPQQHIFTETMFLYLNDMEEKNEETYCIKVICQ